MVGLQTLDLAIGVRVPASQPKYFRPRPGSTPTLPGFLLCYRSHLAESIVSRYPFPA